MTASMVSSPMRSATRNPSSTPARTASTPPWFPTPLPVYRVGELSRRTGVSAQLLRAWERRYGLLRPARSPGGLRLYSDADLERVRAMQQHLAAGVAAAEAAALATRTGAPTSVSPGRPRS